MAISRSSLARFSSLLEDPKWVESVLHQAAQAKSDPFSHSSLPYWLKLETWTRREGVLILGGIDPTSIEVDEASFSCEPWEFLTAQPFSQPPNFTLEPCGPVERESYPGDDESFDGYVERAEEVDAILRAHRKTIEALCHVLDRSINGLGDSCSKSLAGYALYRPAQFIAWAASIKYEIPWLPWALKTGLIDGDAGSPYYAPFFDADAEDYPELLAIAVRAWEHARQVKAGTPKQRVLDFLADRYPALPQGSRDAIAQVANWNRMGGRPAKKTETGG